MALSSTKAPCAWGGPRLEEKGNGSTEIWGPLTKAWALRDSPARLPQGGQWGRGVQVTPRMAEVDPGCGGSGVWLSSRDPQASFPLPRGFWATGDAASPGACACVCVECVCPHRPGGKCLPPLPAAGGGWGSERWPLQWPRHGPDITILLLQKDSSGKRTKPPPE